MLIFNRFPFHSVPAALKLRNFVIDSVSLIDFLFAAKLRKSNRTQNQTKRYNVEENPLYASHRTENVRKFKARPH